MAPRILIVDDNSDCRSIFARYLDRLGYETSEAENSAQAIQKAVAERPDLILTDLQLSDMDAVRAAAILKQDPLVAKFPFKIPIIVLTGMADTRCRRQALKTRIARYLLKPISLSQLSAEIEIFAGGAGACCPT
jgi:CheY-like chemotaxis protein